MINRRALLTGLARIGTLGVAASPIWARGVNVAPPGDDAATRMLRAALSNAAGARQIGMIYLQQPGAERNRDAALGALLASTALTREQVAGMQQRTLHRTLQERMRADYASGNAVNVEGWILSRTEARLCALWT